MRIDSNFNSGGVDGPGPSRRSAAGSRRNVDKASFAGTDALDTSMRVAPDVRAVAVENAKALIADSSYPSPEVTRGIAKLLAVNLSGGE